MTDNSTSNVIRAAIDAYLDTVERALVDADAPRGDRLQVLQDLDTQIADMLAQQPMPLTEESVRAVLDRLEPPNHFAAPYVNCSKTGSPRSGGFAPLQRQRWPFFAAASAAILTLGFLFALLTVNAGPNDLLIFLALLCGLVGLVATPFATWKASKQLCTEQCTSRQRRDFVQVPAVVYGAVAPILIVWVAAEMTDGAALIAIGIGAFLYCQYSIIRRLWQHLEEDQPQAATLSPRKANGSGATSPAAAATPMPAV